MKKWLLTLLFGSALVLSACGGDGSDDSNDGASDSGDGATTETAAGEEIYKNNCASCHGGDLSGGMGPELTTVGAKYSAEEIADIIDNGMGSMPAVNMTAEDRDAVAEWLASHK